MQDFKDPQTHEINYKLILDALLMPFFQLQTRILEKQAFFTIGEIQFFVASTAPHDFGKVSRKTRVKLSAAVERSQSIQRINLVPLRRLDMSKHELLQSVLKPYFSSNIGNCLFKAQVFEIQEQEFFVKYCRPFFGVISNGTEVKMDSSMPKSVRVVRVAPIWPTKEAFAFASRQSEESIRLIKQEILHPYFFSGSMCYIEKGETIKIAGHDFFINECQPRAGIVDESSAVEVEIGFTQETFQKKQVLADQRYAERLQQQIAGSQGVSPNVVSLARPATFAEHHPAELDYQQYLRDLEAAEAQNLNRPSNQINSRISLGSFRGVGGSGSSRRRRRHSQNHNAVGSGASETRFHLEYSPSLMQAYGAQAEEFQRQHSSHLYGSQSLSQSQAQPDLIEILTQIRQDGINIDELQIADQLRHTSQNATPKSIVDSLPVRTITEEQVMTSKGQAQKEEAMAKCMICLVDYEAQDELRTMPCMHFFHRECIDRWLLKQGQTCPICKFNVRQDYNITSSAQITQNRRTSERQSYILRPADLDFYSDD